MHTQKRWKYNSWSQSSSNLDPNQIYWFMSLLFHSEFGGDLPNGRMFRREMCLSAV